ncbi:villin-1-like isoform X2 [Planococcus citri]
MPEENEDYAADPAFKHIRKNATGFLIWRVENMQLVPLPLDQYGTFYEGDSYLIYAASEFAKFVGPRTKAYEVRGRLEIHIHFWLGAKTSTDESTIAAYKCVELDTYLGGTPTQHREIQGQESPRFKGYFKKGIRLLKGGVASGLHHVENTFEARLFRVKGRRSPTITQMPAISWEYMNSGDVFILDTKEVTFVWVGRNSNNIEKLKAATAGQEIRDEHNGLSLVFVDDGKETELPDSERTVFSLYLDTKNRHGLHMDTGSAGLPDDNEADSLNGGELRLYKCVDEGGTYRIFEIKTGNLHQSDLTSNDTYIVDNHGRTIWVWLGKQASKKERIDAIRNAHGFVKKKNYPSYIPVCRVMEGGEPIEFRSLFCSWRDHDVNNNISNGCISSTIANKGKAMPANLSTQTLHNTPKLAAQLQLMDDAHGKLSVWRVKNSSLKEVPYFMYGRFYSRTCYIVHYKYTYDSKEYHVLYCWMGSHSIKSDQTNAMSSLLTKNESINNSGTLVYIQEGNETPHFLSIFRGRMTIFIDEHRDEIPSRFLLHVIGSRYYDSYAKQVPAKTSSLDSNDVFILHCSDKICYVWCGKGSTGDQREMAKSIANKVSSSEELLVIYEGHEKNEFWKQIGGSNEYARNKKINVEHESRSVRLFHCYNASNNLKTEEIMNFQQSDLVSEDVMLLDNIQTVYVWIGELVKNEEKKHAYDTAVEYLKRDASERNLKTPTIVIREGHEPVTFVGFFETWDHEMLDKRKTFAQIRTELEKQNPTLHIQIKSNDDDYNFDECEKFPIEKLLIKNPDQLPAGVDPSHKELHLSHAEFFAVFGMKYSEFCQLAQWKRANMKKAAGLF